MRRILALLASLVLGSALGFAQGAASNPSPAANAPSEGRANGKAVTPERAKTAPPGTAADNTTNGRKAADNTPIPGSPDTIARPNLFSAMPWLWAGMGIVGTLILIGILTGIGRSPGATGGSDGQVVAMNDHRSSSRDNDIRKAG